MSELRAAAEIKLRAEQKAGELLATFPLRGGDQKSKSHDATSILDELGIDKHQSSKWQRAAAVPEGEFQRYLDETNAARKELPAAGLLQLARCLGLCGSRPNPMKAWGAGFSVIDATLQEVKNHFGVLSTYAYADLRNWTSGDVPGRAQTLAAAEQGH